VSESRTAVIAAFAGNATLAVLKGTSAVVTGSAAMLAETFHSIADTGNQALLMVGMRLAERPPDAAHPFGYGKNVYFWAFVVSVMLFTLGGAFAIWEAVRTFLHPHPHETTSWTYAVLGGAFLFESAALTVALRSLRAAKGAHSLRQYWRDNRDPTLVTIVFEDSAALLSLVVAAAGVRLGAQTGSSWWDGVASAVIGVILIVVAVVLALENYSLLIGESAPADVERTIRSVTLQDASVVGVVALHTMHLGPRAILIALGVEFRPELSAPAIADAVVRLQQHIYQAVEHSTTARLILIEATHRDTAAFGPGMPRAAQETTALSGR